jgi:EF hand
MKKILLASAVLAAATGLAFAAGTATNAPPDGDGHPMMGHGRWGGHMGMMHGGFHHHDMFGALIARYDANGDGSITRAEIDAGIAKDFHAADTNHDGKLTNDELIAFIKSQHEAMMAKMGRQEPPKDDQSADGKDGKDGHDHHWGHPPDMDHMDLVKRLDWNMDGALSLEEFAAPIRLAAMRLDRDGNGTITATDLLGHGRGPMEH